MTQWFEIDETMGGEYKLTQYSDGGFHVLYIGTFSSREKAENTMRKHVKEEWDSRINRTYKYDSNGMSV